MDPANTKQPNEDSYSCSMGDEEFAHLETSIIEELDDGERVGENPE